MNTRRLIAVGLMALSLLLGSTISANAAVKYRNLGSFGPAAAPSNVAVDQTRGNVFVAAIGEGTVNDFKLKGSNEYELTQKLPKSGEAPPQGSFAFHTNEPAPVAVDSSDGAVYVIDPATFVVDKFDTEGKYLCQLSGPSRGCLADPESELGSPSTFGELTGVAIDSHGNIYVSDYTNEAVDEFTAAGVYIGQIKGGGIANPSGVAVDSNGVVAEATSAV